MTVKKPLPGELDAIETASRDEISALQLERLKWSLRHTYDNVAPYREKCIAQSNLHAQIVPFNGTPAVITALRGGQVDAAVEILGPVKSQLAAKAMRALAVLGESRPADLPGVIAARELPGLSGINVSSWNALAAPARTAPAVLERLNREVAKALQAPEVRKRLADLSVQPRASSPEQLARLLDGDIKRWSAVIQRAGIPRQ